MGEGDWSQNLCKVLSKNKKKIKGGLGGGFRVSQVSRGD